MEREAMEFDVVIVGGGPAGLSAACRLKQMAQDAGEEISVVLVEKGSEIGAHILSGAVFEPSALNELFPDWKERGAPLKVPVKGDVFHFMLSQEKALPVPNLFIPKTMHNEGNYIASLGNICRWLGEQAEELGVEIFPGFTASEILYHEDGSVKGIATGDMGIDKDGKEKGSFTAGYELHAKYTIFSEGCRGHLGKQLISKFNLDEGKDPQHYGIGIKEVWEIDADKHDEGLVVHTLGWPMDSHTEGGGFLYHAENNQVFLGYIVSLSYTNPYMSPYEEFQRWKQHPKIRHYIEGGKRITYGARAMIKGGIQALPKLSFPGGALAGCEAGTLNNAKIKGSHTAMKSGMITAETIGKVLLAGDAGRKDLTELQTDFENSSLYEELHTSRNYGPLIHKFGTMIGGSAIYMDQNFFGGKLPFTLHNMDKDHESLKPASQSKPIDYAKPDGVISFSRLDSVFLSNTNHEEDQPCHLQLKDPNIPLNENFPKFAEPAQRFCPAGVYEIVEEDDGSKKFQINAQNCVHCKTCDIKDPAQNITWVTPEGGGGPNYPNM